MPNPKRRQLSYANPKKQCNCGCLLPHTCEDIGKGWIERSKWVKHTPFPETANDSTTTSGID